MRNRFRTNNSPRWASQTGFVDRLAEEYCQAAAVCNAPSSFAEIKVGTWEVVPVNEVFAFDKNVETK